MRVARPLVALALYATAALVLVGRPLLAGGADVAGIGNDPDIFVWSLGWWPHALGAGQLGPHTDAIWHPTGVDLLWATSVPGAALPLAPVTAHWGPVVAWDLAIVLAPTLSAFAAYLLCRSLAGWLPSLIGGWLYGFGSWELGQTLGHLHMAWLFVPPLIALVAVARVQGRLGRPGLVASVAPLLALQFLLSTEVALTLGLCTLIALALAWWRSPPDRAAVRLLAREGALAALAGAVLVAPLLVLALADLQTTAYNSPAVFSADLLNLVVPTPLTALGGAQATHISTHFRGNLAEQGGYLSLPLAALVLLEWRRAGDRHQRLLALLCLTAALLALGPVLRVAGFPLAPLPWLPLAFAPLTNHVLPVRLMAYATLALAVLVARSLTHWATRRAWTLVALGVALTLPSLGLARSTPDSTPALFRDGSWRSLIAPGQVVLALPYANAGHSMLWQVHADYGFAQAGGYILPDPPASFRRLPIVEQLRAGTPPGAEGAGALRSLLRQGKVDRVVLDASLAGLYRPLLDAAGLGRPRRLGGALVWDVRP